MRGCLHWFLTSRRATGLRYESRSVSVPNAEPQPEYTQTASVTVGRWWSTCSAFDSGRDSALRHARQRSGELAAGAVDDLGRALGGATQRWAQALVTLPVKDAGEGSALAVAEYRQRTQHAHELFVHEQAGLRVGTGVRRGRQAVNDRERRPAVSGRATATPGVLEPECLVQQLLSAGEARLHGEQCLV